MLIYAAVFSALLAPNIVLAVPTRRSSPAVTLDDAIFTGLSSGEVNKFLGIPYAQPPIGDLRFRLPQPIPPYNASDSMSATAFGFSCPQQTGGNTPNVAALPKSTVDFLLASLSNTTTTDNESCLTLNVVTPSSATSSSKLPVVIFIAGGGFTSGSSSTTDGSPVVERSMALDEPIIYVSFNYRVSAFGFLASKEVKEAGVGNLGLQDQREAMRWVQKYISEFGGDPTKVTIWGESAGSMSVGFHMVANDGDSEGLFRGAFMESGSPLQVGDITHGQPYFDAIVSETGCSSAADKLDCLRKVPYVTLVAAMNKSPGIYGSYQVSIIFTWPPRVDGNFITDNPQVLIAAGKVAAVPMISGDCDDEGTLFSLTTLNITTTAQFGQWLQTTWFPQAPASAVNRILEMYPEDPTLGSPFNTGTNNSLTAQYKRIAAFQGDIVYQATRRYLLNAQSGKQNIWSYLYKRYKDLAALGSLHASDNPDIYAGKALADYLINFVTNLDPNGDTNVPWPQYTTSSPNMLTFYDDPNALNVTQDTYREAQIAYLIELTLAHPIW
ncbi:alpha beta-hydrolase [Athelia psychrophila]|uniref:Carboxylic ester hydrolase n=1 Tax=Athelia psychrophila TaxID=1759441 RepID=A0A166Q635_9AGAM|nr:alpha beta-hydrolase [Fibularhizoctonia sp. CBS 109695]